ncbi:MAG: MarR family winged helix-turn-helix transcriptional regulator [Desulfococcaceae bacterium]
MPTPFDQNMLMSLRRIVQANRQCNNVPNQEVNLTVPQLLCLQQLLEPDIRTPSQIARRTFLSQATVTGIADRLVERGLIRRDRDLPDRRQVVLTLTDEGRKLAKDRPWPLPANFSANFEALPPEEQASIDACLRRVADMMDPVPGED